jgi:Two component regulator propeller
MRNLASSIPFRLTEAILVSAFLISPALAQRFSFKYYGQEQGLSNLATECLFQDRGGYLWVGTQNGLFRYDGAEFTRFGQAEGLPSSSIESITETPDGLLWVATQAGIAERHGAIFKAVNFGKQLADPGHFGLASNESGRIYLSTAYGLLTSAPAAAGSERTFEKVAGQGSEPTYGLYTAPDDSVWFGCGFDVCRLSQGQIEVFDEKKGVPPAMGRDCCGSERHGLDSQFEIPVTQTSNEQRLCTNLRAHSEHRRFCHIKPRRGRGAIRTYR